MIDDVWLAPLGTIRARLLCICGYGRIEHEVINLVLSYFSEGLLRESLDSPQI